MIILRVAVLNGASYEFEAHIPHAQRAGMSDAKIEALKKPAIGGEFSDLRRFDQLLDGHWGEHDLLEDLVGLDVVSGGLRGDLLLDQGCSYIGGVDAV